MDGQVFANRREAGAVLAAALERYKDRDDVVVLALPRGGVPVGYEVAKRLGAPLDVFVVRKLGVPGHRELAMGAIAPGGVRVLNRSIVDWYHIPPQAIEETAREELAELERREHAYRGARGPLEVAGKTVILVDDGLATGSTMKAAVQAVRELGPARVVVAVPTGAAETCASMRRLARGLLRGRRVVRRLLPDVGLRSARAARMNQREIPRQEWPQFLASFGRRHRSWLATIEEWPREAPERTRAVDQPLESLDAEDGAIAIRLGNGEVLRVEAPQALRIDVTERGEELGFDLDTARGVTRLRFRAAALPEELDGIAPSER